VYFYIHSLRFEVVCFHYLALYVVTPVVYLLSGWYAQRFDRLHVFRLGVAFHAIYYGLLLALQEEAANHAVALGGVLGIAWGLFWAGNNTFNYDVVNASQRDYFFGWLNALTGASRFAAPALSALILFLVPGEERGYYVLFATAVGLYLCSIVASAWVPADSQCRPFHLRRALFPGKDQRDWRLVMWASVTQAGSFHIFYILLGLAMYMKTGNAASVGAFTSFQYLAGIAVSYYAGRWVRRETRRTYMFWGTVLLVAAGAIIGLEISITTLIVFGFIRSIAEPMYMIPYSSIRLDVIDGSVREPAERIEYMCASEVPLAAGRIFMMLLLLALSGTLDELGLRIALFLLCANRIVTYLIIVRTGVVQKDA
jgi:YQGE family putative transporter